MFLLAKMDVGMTPPIEYHHTASEITLGEALTLETDELSKCAATTKPDYVAVGPKDANGMVPCIKVQAYMIFDTIFQASAASLHLGDKVTLHTDGLQVTATVSSGVATIIHMDGTGVGDHVQVRF